MSGECVATVIDADAANVPDSENRMGTIGLNSGDFR